MFDRRSLLKHGSVAGFGVLAARVGLAGTVTPPQTEGPFYPVEDRLDKDPDLTLVMGRNNHAKGEVVIVSGTVKDGRGNVLTGAIVEVWQACATGRYNHPRDPNTGAELDPNFQYFARMLTDNQGRYRFKTVIPGAYPASETWYRPPHIHFRIDAWGKNRLTTQMYFKGHPLNVSDRILIQTENDFGKDAKESLIVDFSSIDADGIASGVFNITIGSTPAVD